MRPPGGLLRAARQQARESGRIMEAERWEARLRLLVNDWRDRSEVALLNLRPGMRQAAIDLEEVLDELSRRKNA